MIVLRDEIEIQAPPERIFQWFTHLNKNYRTWHPKDHVELRYIKGSLTEKDSLVYFEEYLHGKLEKMKFRVTGIEPNARIEYQFLFPFPYSLFKARGAFITKRCGKNTSFIAEICWGYNVPVLGKAIDKLIHKSLTVSQLQAIKQHMLEEGQNLKCIMEETTGSKR
ncbi:MAG: hypothetical protein J7L90_00715 [Dehalococcoidia bacterium]|nr:hypothetical protein [Dehalococcoidia bacterium]